MSRQPVIVLVLSFTVALGAAAQQSGERDIAKKTQELEALRKEIQAYEQKLRESEKKERTTLEHLDNLERQSTLIRRLIQKLREQEKQITNDINEAKSSIDEYQKQLEFLKAHYARYVRSVYKNSRVYDLELLFSSNSINQLSIRIQYLKRFSEQRAKDLQSIVEKKTSLERQNERLQEALKAERALLAEKTKEEQTLIRKASQRKSVLSKIRSDKQLFQKELSRKTQAAREIEKMIAELIERERIRKEKEAAAARERERSGATTPPPAPEPTGTFEQRRGRLRWPVAGGAIASRFGRQVHPVLKTVTQNTGIDISIAAGTNVVAVADGEVSVLSFIPGFGNVLILNHYNGYRTVYAHLSDIAVAETERVREGQVIAKSGDSPGGTVLHFEIWKDREKQDPELWLAKQR
ncbi:MAG TPA: peptidoglycan DD-metalloendopeptidase family protein [Bacteroidota bacterium]|nr:peptidoglycan DD-metalloendopeptidase family protein [Bacteroidota bacterium]